MRRARMLDAAIPQYDRFRAKFLDSCHVVTDKQNSSSTVRNLIHPSKTASLKLEVTYSQDFVDDQYLGLQVRGDGECQSYIHSRRIALHWCVQKLFYFRECNNLIELSLDLLFRHPQDRAI